MAAGESATRSKDIYFLLDFIVKEFYGSKLPSNRDALGVFIRRHIEEKQTIRESAAKTIRDLIPIWTGQARIPLRPEHRAIMQLEALFQTWKDLKRLRNRRNPAQIKKEITFVDNLDDLFDISHANTLDMIVLQEDKEFLLAQREKVRRGCMGSVDKALLAAKDERIMQKRKAEEMRKKKSEGECKAPTSNDVILASSSSSEDGDSTDGSMADVTEEPHPKRSRAGQNIVAPSLAPALDRTQEAYPDQILPNELNTDYLQPEDIKQEAPIWQTKTEVDLPEMEFKEEPINDPLGDPLSQSAPLNFIDFCSVKTEPTEF